MCGSFLEWLFWRICAKKTLIRGAGERDGRVWSAGLCLRPVALNLLCVGGYEPGGAFIRQGFLPNLQNTVRVWGRLRLVICARVLAAVRG